LAGYGTGERYGSSCGDERDYAFANFFESSEWNAGNKNIFFANVSKEACGSRKRQYNSTNSIFLGYDLYIKSLT
jgi:leucyl-tRNA synthetase